MGPDETGAVTDDLAALVDRIPVGWTSVEFGGRRWGLGRADHAGGRTSTIEAEELGGAGRVGANVIRLTGGSVLKPCEMPAAEVLEFLRGWR